VVAQSPILDVQDLKTHFFTRTGVVKAVDGVSFSLMPGETLGIVGESGSGKSMTALSIMGLVPQPAGRIVGGRILFQGEDLVPKSNSEMQHIRGQEICMILQDPMTSLNPVFTVGNQLVETLRTNSGERTTGLRRRAIELLEKTIEADPDDKKVPETRFFLAQCTLQLGNKKEALGIYNEIAKKHPKSKWAKKAKTEAERLITEQDKRRK